MTQAHGRLFVFSGPSGAGLKEILKNVLQGRENIGYVVPVTARKMRSGEVNGQGFWFYDLDQWAELKASGGLLEQTEFAGNDYGTSRKLVQEQLSSGKHVVLNLEVERAAQIKKNMPEAFCVYVEPAGEETLRGRYRQSCRSEIEVSVRMEEAARQRALSGFCDLRLDSTDEDAAAEKIKALLG